MVYHPLRVDLARLRREVAREARHAGWGPTVWVATEAHDGGASALSDALGATRPDLVIAAGGDGTVSMAAGALSGRSLPLAVVPVGTTNLFARSVGATGSVDRAVAHAFAAIGTGTPDESRVDLGRFRATLADGSVVERPFTVMVGAGIDAAMVADTHPRGKERFGWLGYIQGISASIWRNERFAVRVSLDEGSAVSETAHTVVVANGGLLPAGLVFVPGAVVEDGELDVMVLRPRSVLSWARLAAWFVASAVRAPSSVGRGLAGSAVRVTRAGSVDVSFEVPERAEADGEELGHVSRLEAWIEPGALRIVR
ncbi:diacylglycerol kinase family enzyme [Labedella gwakjiensis]|uniref:Diacylglycerol kinase family enzyme n=1 Tax=Labedella gwakjiensis TaxID=390269 RepID=A0A2P8GZD0_9MICO|nr:diacylglycerol kinase family protein [Labedella gwakjiensis]PSL39315.1 diacylglycerol kinase family enzyme [Labedella gwakjiensis]